MALSLRSTLKLNNGVEIPLLGLGVFRSPPGPKTRQAVLHALAAGYRHVDTAHIYDNERDVGEAVRQSGLPREELFITTKLWNADHGYDRALRAFDRSAAQLGVDYLDLYLIHWPVEGLRLESWRALESLQRSGRCRAIGVSNFTVSHLSELLARCEVVPAINQVELHPFLYQRELIEFCRSKGIAVEAYSPLAKAQKLDEPALVRLAAKYKKTPAQILIRWSLQHGLVVIPKSIRKQRIEQNADVFDFAIASADMQELDSLNSGLRTAWDPTDVP